MAMDGGFLSTLLPPMGPAVVQFCARSQTAWGEVCAFAVSVPAATEVAREKLASAPLARPERASDAAQPRVTSPACHRPSGAAQLTIGGDGSYSAITNGLNEAVVAKMVSVE